MEYDFVFIGFTGKLETRRLKHFQAEISNQICKTVT